MKHKELKRLLAGIEKASDIPSSPVLAIACAKNHRTVREALEDLEKTREPSEGFRKYEKEWGDLVREHSEKDERGNPIVREGGQVHVDEDPEVKAEFVAKHESLREGYVDDIEAHEKKIETFVELLDMDCSLKLAKIEVGDIPEEFVTGALLVSIEEMVKL